MLEILLIYVEIAVYTVQKLYDRVDVKIQATGPVYMHYHIYN